MKREDLILVIAPFLISGLIIFGHYQFLINQNPDAHSRPLITRNRVQQISSEDLRPISPDTPLPKNISGITSEIPTNNNQLQELFTKLKTQDNNTLALIIGITIDANGDLIIPKALESSEEMLIRWTKKTVSEAHQAGYHTYLSFTMVEEPAIKDYEKFIKQLGAYIERWTSFAQEYYVAFFDPGIIIGHPTFEALSKEQRNNLVSFGEQKTRETFTGRIGIGVCCKEVDIDPHGYNHILILSRSETLNQKTKDKFISLAKRSGVERVFVLDIEDQSLLTLY